MKFKARITKVLTQTVEITVEAPGFDDAVEKIEDVAWLTEFGNAELKERGVEAFILDANFEKSKWERVM